jgi:hypothetical protein
MSSPTLGSVSIARTTRLKLICLGRSIRVAKVASLRRWKIGGVAPAVQPSDPQRHETERSPRLGSGFAREAESLSDVWAVFDQPPGVDRSLDLPLRWLRCTLLDRHVHLRRTLLKIAGPNKLASSAVAARPSAEPTNNVNGGMAGLLMDASPVPGSPEADPGLRNGIGGYGPLR